MKLELNRPDKLTITSKRIGADGNALVIVDDVFANADEIRKFALGIRYNRGSMNNYYPGYTSGCQLAGVAELVNWAAKIFWDCYGLKLDPFVHPRDLTENAFFALLAPDPAGTFVNVHVDGHSWLAALIYLSSDAREDSNRGTAFWRDKSTGLQSLVKADVPFLQKLESTFGLNIMNVLKESYLDAPIFTMEQVQRNFMDDRAGLVSYPHASHGEWELLEFIPERFNRMILYPTWQFHSVAYPDYVPPTHIENARMTLNLFIESPLLKRNDVHYLAVANLPGLVV